MADDVSIGEFARRTRLTPKALRLYDRLGLLPPVAVEDNGYRRYHPDQVRTGQLIGLLRGAGLGLAEITAVLAELAHDPERAATRLDLVLGEQERQHASRKLLIRHVQATIRNREDTMFPIKTRHVRAQRVMSMQRRVIATETDGFVREAKDAFADLINGARPTGPFMLIFHAPVSPESDGLLEAALGCPSDVAPSDVVGIRTEPAHDEAYTTITKAQWDYPAILAAYDAVACSPEVTGRPRSRLSCREVYLAEPDELDADDPICDIAFPLGDATHA